MPFSSIGKFLPKIAKPRFSEQVGAALALEAGTGFIAAQNQLLAKRIKLVSVKNGVLHALSSSAPAKVELANLKKGLISAIKSKVDIPLNDLKITLRGTLADDDEF